MDLYHSIPDIPSETSATNVLARVVDGLGFRYKWATEGLTENELEFRPCDSSMTMQALLEHVYHIASIANRVFGGSVVYNQSITDFIELRAETLRMYDDLSQRLKEMDDAELEQCNFNIGPGKTFPYWFLINGPIVDALTHVGQINSWRRIAGNPLPRGINPFIGKKMP